MIKLSISIVSYKSTDEQLEALFFSLLSSIAFARQSLDLAIVPIYLVENSEEAHHCTSRLNQKQKHLEKFGVVLNELSGHGNVGYGRAHNLVLKELKSDVHLMLNPDVTVADDAITNAVRLIDSNQEIKMLSPNATNASGEKQYLCKRYPSVLTLFLRGLFSKGGGSKLFKQLDNYEMRDLSESKATVDIPLISGCFMMVDTRTLQELCGFNEGYFLYFEDFDLSLRIAGKGKLAYAPNVRIVHFGGNTSSKGLWHILEFLKSGIRFFNTYGWRFF